jgi:hypothetical protein
MPYIDKNLRARFNSRADVPRNAGELNYVITKTIMEYCSTGGYQEINDVLGALEGAKLEFYRRVAVPYEDQKIKDNGDVY